MTKLKLLSVFFTLLAFAFGFQTDPYTGYQVWRVTSPSRDVIDLIELVKLDVWASGPQWVDIMVPSDKVNLMRQELLGREVEFSVNIQDVARVIEETAPSLKAASGFDKRASFDFAVYHPLDEIMSYLDNLTSSSAFVSQEERGRTVEGRELRLVTVSVSTDPKPAVWIDCGIHAREWITEATCLWGLDHLVNGYSINDEVTDFLDTFNVYMIPVLNPDGYDFTWTDDRLWRKNRNSYAANGCVGVDLNRNFGEPNWGGVGSSNLDCSDIFHGPTPFSEVESSTVRDTLTSLMADQEIRAYFSIHAYGQLWMYAYASIIDLPAEDDELDMVSSIGVAAAAESSGTVYENGPHYTVIYPASGTSLDWGYSKGIVHTYITELRDNGTHGFLLPEDEILPTATEIWHGIIAAVLSIPINK